MAAVRANPLVSASCPSRAPVLARGSPVASPPIAAAEPKDARHQRDARATAGPRRCLRWAWAMRAAALLRRDAHCRTARRAGGPLARWQAAPSGRAPVPRASARVPASPALAPVQALAAAAAAAQQQQQQRAEPWPARAPAPSCALLLSRALFWSCSSSPSNSTPGSPAAASSSRSPHRAPHAALAASACRASTV